MCYVHWFQELDDDLNENEILKKRGRTGDKQMPVAASHATAKMSDLIITSEKKK